MCGLGLGFGVWGLGVCGQGLGLGFGVLGFECLGERERERLWAFWVANLVCFLHRCKNILCTAGSTEGSLDVLQDFPIERFLSGFVSGVSFELV